MSIINSLLPQNRINDKYNVIQTYQSHKKDIDELMIVHVTVQLLKDETIPKHWFNAQNINSEEFRSYFKPMILKHIRPFLKSLFPFDKYNPNSILRQETQLVFIIYNNYEHNLSNIMNNIYEEVTFDYDVNKLNEVVNKYYHILQHNIFKSILESRIEAKTNNITRPVFQR